MRFLVLAAALVLSDGILDQAVRESERKLERVEFERDQLEERRGFLRVLRRLPAEERGEAWLRFRQEQQQSEALFQRRQERRRNAVTARGEA